MSSVMRALRELEAEGRGKRAPARAVAVPTLTVAKMVSAKAILDANEVPALKPARGKAGKKKPTKDEKAWMDSIVRYGCIACHLDGRSPRPTAVHHLLRGSRRIGHKATIGLCDPGHHQGGQQFGMVSRHPYKARFEEKYGTEEQLHRKLVRLLVKQKDGTYAPKAGWSS